jgi:hypothetical protein
VWTHDLNLNSFWLPVDASGSPGPATDSEGSVGLPGPPAPLSARVDADSQCLSPAGSGSGRSVNRWQEAPGIGIEAQAGATSGWTSADSRAMSPDQGSPAFEYSESIRRTSQARLGTYDLHTGTYQLKTAGTLAATGTWCTRALIVLVKGLAVAAHVANLAGLIEAAALQSGQVPRAVQRALLLGILAVLTLETVTQVRSGGRASGGVAPLGAIE